MPAAQRPRGCEGRPRPRRLTPPPGAARFLCSRSQLLKSVQARHGFLDGSSAPEPAAPAGTGKGKGKGPPSAPGNPAAPRPGRPSLGAAILAPRCTLGRGRPPLEAEVGGE